VHFEVPFTGAAKQAMLILRTGYPSDAVDVNEAAMDGCASGERRR
jgi:hypothetical protein